MKKQCVFAYTQKWVQGVPAVLPLWKIRRILFNGKVRPSGNFSSSFCRAKKSPAFFRQVKRVTPKRKNKTALRSVLFFCSSSRFRLSPQPQLKIFEGAKVKTQIFVCKNSVLIFEPKILALAVGWQGKKTGRDFGRYGVELHPKNKQKKGRFSFSWYFSNNFHFYFMVFYGCMPCYIRVLLIFKLLIT